MTDDARADRTLSIEEAVDRHDVTIAFTPGQLALLAIGIVILLRIIRGLRG